MDTASRILALASTGVKLSTALYSLGSAVSYAEKDMSDIAGDVALTSNVLTNVGTFLRDQDTRAIATPSALQDAESIVKRCKDSFADIKAIVDKDVVVEEEGKRKTSKRAKLAWPLKSSRAELLKRRLESLKSSLMLLLQVLTFAKDQAHGRLATESMARGVKSIQALHKRHQEALASVSILERSLQCTKLEGTADTSQPSPRVAPLQRVMDTQTSSDSYSRETLISSAVVGIQTVASSAIVELPKSDDSDYELSLADIATLNDQARQLLKQFEETQKRAFMGQLSLSEAGVLISQEYCQFSQMMDMILERSPWKQALHQQQISEDWSSGISGLAPNLVPREFCASDPYITADQEGTSVPDMYAESADLILPFGTAMAFEYHDATAASSSTVTSIPSPSCDETLRSGMDEDHLPEKATPPLVLPKPSSHQSPYHGTVQYLPYVYPSARRPSMATLSQADRLRGHDVKNQRGESRIQGQCPVSGCGRTLKDLKAHMLTHSIERPEKCPVQTCQYYTQGFARRYDQNRHVLTHFKGVIVCPFCPGRESLGEKKFTRADVLKRHLTSIHGVQQILPDSRRKAQPTKVPKSSSDTPGACSLCLVVFENAQMFYEHLDECVLRVVHLDVVPLDTADLKTRPSHLKSPKENGRDGEQATSAIEALESRKRKLDDDDARDDEEETAQSSHEGIFATKVLSDGEDIVSELLARWTTIVPQTSFS